MDRKEYTEGYVTIEKNGYDLIESKIARQCCDAAPLSDIFGYPVSAFKKERLRNTVARKIAMEVRAPNYLGYKWIQFTRI